jgi:uncharacterized protein (DUF1697 family)
MKYVALLRGINAGKLRRVDMGKLKALFESLGYTHATTYINSGNVLFESDAKAIDIRRIIEEQFKKEFAYDIPTLVKTQEEMKKIAKAIPKEWKNDPQEKSDVAYLFETIDSPKTIDELPIKKEFVDIRYTPGALFWNIDRKNYNRSQINKIISHNVYKYMTMRNVNTARFLAGMK